MSKTYQCTDGHVTKEISASSAHEAAEAYALVTSEVSVVEVDDDGNPMGKPAVIRVTV